MSTSTDPKRSVSASGGLAGRRGLVTGRSFGCRNSIGGGGQTKREWGVRIGQASSDDVRFSNAPEGDRWGGGFWLHPDEAEELAAHLMRCVAWARAQNVLDTQGQKRPEGDRG